MALTRLAYGFIVNFKNHIGIRAPFFRLNLEEFLGTTYIVHRRVGVIVDNHVNILLNSRLDRLVQQVLIIFSLAINKVMSISPALVVYRHGGTDYLDALLAYHSRNDIISPKAVLVFFIAPEKAHALYLDLVSAGVRISITTAIHTTFVLRVYARH